MVTQLKILLVVNLLFFSNLATSQNLDSLGLNDNSKLNSYESTFLNVQLERQCKRAEFDFSGKQIGFATGHGPKHYGVLTKTEFFQQVKNYYHSTNSHIENLILVIFTEQERQESGGYEAAIVSWSKFAIDDKARQELIVNLKSGT